MNLPQTFSIEDITSYGVEGLIDAIENIHPTKEQGLRLMLLCV